MKDKTRQYRNPPRTAVRDPSTIRPSSPQTLWIGLLLGAILLTIGVYLITSVFVSCGPRSYWRVLVASILGRNIFDVLEEEIQNAIIS